MAMMMSQIQLSSNRLHRQLLFINISSSLKRYEVRHTVARFDAIDALLLSYYEEFEKMFPCCVETKRKTKMRRVLKDSFYNKITERQAVTTRGSLV